MYREGKGKILRFFNSLGKNQLKLTLWSVWLSYSAFGTTLLHLASLLLNIKLGKFTSLNIVHIRFHLSRLISMFTLRGGELRNEAHRTGQIQYYIMDRLTYSWWKAVRTEEDSRWTESVRDSSSYKETITNTTRRWDVTADWALHYITLRNATITALQLLSVNGKSISKCRQRIISALVGVLFPKTIKQ